MLLDTGASRSVLNQPLATLTQNQVEVVGVSGQPQPLHLTEPQACHFAGREFIQEYIYSPDCPISLMGRDLLSKLGARILIPWEKGASSAVLPVFPPPTRVMLVGIASEYWRLFSLETAGPPSQELIDWLGVPGVWAEHNPPGLAKDVSPVLVELKPGVVPVHQKQYPLPREAVEKVGKHLQRLLQHHILHECQSPWNTPLLPVRKPGTDDYRPVQDLRAINEVTETLHPIVPNPYVILGFVPHEATWFSVLDLKDAFFSIPLAPQSQNLFAFEWEHPETGIKGQLTWERLVQGWKNSPTLFGTLFLQDLSEFIQTHSEWTFLVYMDDILVAIEKENECLKATRCLLQKLEKKGYRVSLRKAQVCKKLVKYLGFVLSQGQRVLGAERRETVCRISSPRTRRQLRAFLGAAGFCRLLHAATRGAEGDPFQWGPSEEEAFQNIKRALIQAPALGLPDLKKPFTLYASEKEGVAIGVLTQRLGSWQRPVAYLSKQIDMVAKGWPSCLRSVAAG